MKTAGLASLLSAIATFTLACSSQVSIGTNDHRVIGGDSGPGGSGGSGGGEPNVTCSFSMDEGWTEIRAAGLVSGTNPAESDPISGPCSAGPLDASMDVVALYQTNDPIIIDTWGGPGVGMVPSGLFCNVRPESGVVVSTAGAAEQLTVFEVPLHLDAAAEFYLGIRTDVWDGVTEAWSHLYARTTPINGALCTSNRQLLEVSGPALDVNPGTEETVCTRTTLADAIDPSFVRMTTGEAVLDAVLTAGDAVAPDGEQICNDGPAPGTVLAIANRAGTIEERLHGSVHIAAGQQVTVRVHVVNVLEHPISGLTLARLY